MGPREFNRREAAHTSNLQKLGMTKADGWLVGLTFKADGWLVPVHWHDQGLWLACGAHFYRADLFSITQLKYGTAYSFRSLRILMIVSPTRARACSLDIIFGRFHKLVIRVESTASGTENAFIHCDGQTEKIYQSGGYGIL
jgi:hypothetical protein